MKSHQANYRSEIAKDYAAKMTESLNDVVIEKCEGCIHYQQNQLAHDLCLMAHTETQVSTCFDTSPYLDKILRGFNFADDKNFQLRMDLISRLRPS